MGTTWTATELHEELADFYRKYRGVTAPETGYSLSLWSAIEVAEAYEEEDVA